MFFLSTKRRVALARGLVAAGVPGYNNKKLTVFTSGVVSPFYMDCRRIQAFPGIHRDLVAAMVEAIHVHRYEPYIIGGIQNAGIPYSILVADRMNLPHCSIRKVQKAYGRPVTVEGAEVSGRRLVLIEDIVSTAGSPLYGVRSLREAHHILSFTVLLILY